MRAVFIWIVLITGVWASFASSARSQSMLSPAYAETDAPFLPSERAGREIWFFATAFNDRFFTYSFPQRLGAAIDWYGIFGAPFRADLFQAWGAIPDPDCCLPGDPDCPAKSLEQTYGFLWCPGDDDLLAHVGKPGYVDPACSFTEGAYSASPLPEDQLQRQSSCDLRYGTSTGAVGFRKFPNPRFDAAAWERLNKGLASWDGYRSLMSDDTAEPDNRTTRLFDGSVEPPFTIGLACGSCHIAYNPLNPPADPNHPEWSNIDGLVGNQYSRISNLLGSGMPKSSLEWQLIARARPGIVDTSALAMDHVSNPGTMNAVINYARRPLHEHEVLKWRRFAGSCAVDADPRDCWCEPDKDGKCWQRSTQTEMTPNILKGGEDDIGYLEAIQRVYFNIGSCAEQCWVNHLPDLRMVDPSQRNFGQSPFDIGQCRRDCASFRAIEDRLGNVADFFMTARPTDLWQARGLADPVSLEQVLDAEFFAGAVAEGREVFATTCAGCHSSLEAPYDVVDFRATDPKDATLRLDWLGDDELSAASLIGTDNARALHSNHMPGRVWSEYTSLDQRERPSDPAIAEVMHGSGRGYYRNISLLSVWAHAPFLHNNAVGPEICGTPGDKDRNFYVSPYVTADRKPLADAPACWPFDPSVEGRYRLFLASMQDLLNPDQRIPKLFTLSEDILFDIAPQIDIGFLQTGLTLRIPKGTPALSLNSLRYKDLIQDVVLVGRDPAALRAKYDGILSAEQIIDLDAKLQAFRLVLLALSPGKVFSLAVDQFEFIQKYYSNALVRFENSGHAFGAELDDRQKQALIAFLATL